MFSLIIISKLLMASQENCKITQTGLKMYDYYYDYYIGTRGSSNNHIRIIYLYNKKYIICH